MDFTREPIIQTVITPRDGYRLVVRSSKTAGLEEHFVDAVEVVCFGTATFFRSIERPKPFIVPVSDYEVLEVREPRMVLKTPAIASQKSADKPRLKIEAEKPKVSEKEELTEVSIEKTKQPTLDAKQEVKADAKTDVKTERRRERRRGFRKRRGRDEQTQEGDPQGTDDQSGSDDFTEGDRISSDDSEKILTTTPLLSAILPPPTTLIRDDLDRLRGAYRDAFYDIEKEESLENSIAETIEEGLFTQESSNVDILTEDGDSEVSQQGSFREESETEKEEEFFAEDATNAKKYDE